MADVKPIPEGYQRLMPHLCVDGASDAIDFYTNVLGAAERMRMGGPDGKIGHAELAFGDSVLMLADEMPEMGMRGPKAFGGAAVNLYLYVDDVDAVIERATAAGAKLMQPIQDRFYGDRTGTIEDPFGHVWTLGTHVEDVPPDELERRATQMMSGG